MPTISNPNTSGSGQDPELEDIFASTDSGESSSMSLSNLSPGPQQSAVPRPFAYEQTNPTAETDTIAGAQPTAQPTTQSAADLTTEQQLDNEEIPTVRRSGSLRRILIIIAIALVALLLLGGIAWGIYWFMNRPVADPPVEIPAINNPVVNTGIPLNINVTPDTTDPLETTPQNPSTFTDTDHDGLSDEEELLHNTNPKKSDTDEDGLSDREEVRVYLTDPRNPDTDGDTYMDGTEVANFYHPNDPNPKKRLFDLENK